MDLPWYHRMVRHPPQKTYPPGCPGPLVCHPIVSVHLIGTTETVAAGSLPSDGGRRTVPAGRPFRRARCPALRQAGCLPPQWEWSDARLRAFVSSLLSMRIASCPLNEGQKRPSSKESGPFVLQCEDTGVRRDARESLPRMCDHWAPADPVVALIGAKDVLTVHLVVPETGESAEETPSFARLLFSLGSLALESFATGKATAGQSTRHESATANLPNLPMDSLTASIHSLAGQTAAIASITLAGDCGEPSVNSYSRSE
jgi:hypothetical protein